MGFKLLKLPYLVQRMALGQMELMKLFDLTFMSQDLAYAAHTLYITAFEFQTHINENQMSIKTTLLNHDNHNIKISFVIDKVPIKTMFRRWNGRRIQIKRTGKMFTLKVGKDQNENLSILEELTKHLLGILRVEDFHMSSVLNIFETSIFKNTRKFYNVNLKRHDLTVAQTRYLLETMEIDTLHLNHTGPKGPKGEQEDFELKHRIMDLGVVDWLSFKSVLNMKCEILKFERMNHMTPKDFVEFVRTWANGGFENLVEFYCRVPHRWEFHDNGKTYVYRDDLYKSFEEIGITVVKDTREGHQKTLQRKSDGKKAELIFIEYFKFVVLQ